METVVETDILPSTIRWDMAFGSTGGYNSGSLLMNKVSDSEGFNGYSIFISQCYTNPSTSVLSQTLYYPSMEKVTKTSYLTPANSILTLFHPLTTHCMDIDEEDHDIDNKDDEGDDAYILAQDDCKRPALKADPKCPAILHHLPPLRKKASKASHPKSRRHLQTTMILCPWHSPHKIF
jgi:hypothetical protein